MLALALILLTVLLLLCLFSRHAVLGLRLDSKNLYLTARLVVQALAFLLYLLVGCSSSLVTHVFRIHVCLSHAWLSYTWWLFDGFADIG